MRSAIAYIGWAGAALVSLLPMAACQQEPEYGRAPAQQTVGGETEYQQQQPPQASEQSRVLSINDRFEQPLPDRCEYTSTVRGTVRPVPMTSNMQNMQSDVALFEPNLTVNAEVTCPSVQSEHISSHSLNGQQLTRKELEAAVNERASVVTVDHNRVCTIEPKYVLAANGTLHPEGARELCAVGAPAGAMPSHPNEPEWNQGDSDQGGAINPDINQTH